MRIVSIGASTQTTCGLRDYARTLEPHLGADARTVWWERRSESSPSRWLEAVAAAAGDGAVLLWSYAPSPYGPRGLPLGVRGVVRALGRTGAPLVTVAHEVARPARPGGPRALAQSFAQRAAFRTVARASRGVVVTTELRLAELPTGKPAAFVPVPSNVAVADDGGSARNGALRIGVFGFRADGVLPELVAAAVPAAAPAATLVLVGAPGPDSPRAERWRAAASASGCPLEFTGLLEPAELSRALSGLDVVVFADADGPAPRKGTLAAALAHGRPVVAVDGPQRWQRFVESDALVLAAPHPEALAAALRTLAESPGLRLLYGERGRIFYEHELAAERVAERLLAFVRRVTE